MAERYKKNKKLSVPSCRDNKEKEGHFSINMIEEKIVMDFTGFDFDRIDNLTIFEFWLYLRDAVIYNCSQTEEGRNYLEKCWLADQTEPDRASLHKYFKKN